MEVPVYYDPMLAKLICHAADRNQAIEKLIRAIDDFHVSGVSTTLPFCRFAANHEAFRSGKFDTHFVEKHFRPSELEATQPAETETLLAVAFAAFMQQKSKPKVSKTETGSISPWRKNRSHD